MSTFYSVVLGVVTGLVVFLLWRNRRNEDEIFMLTRHKEESEEREKVAKLQECTERTPLSQNLATLLLVHYMKRFPSLYSPRDVDDVSLVIKSLQDKMGPEWKDKPLGSFFPSPSEVQELVKAFELGQR